MRLSSCFPAERSRSDWFRCLLANREAVGRAGRPSPSSRHEPAKRLSPPPRLTRGEGHSPFAFARVRAVSGYVCRPLLTLRRHGGGLLVQEGSPQTVCPVKQRGRAQVMHGVGVGAPLPATARRDSAASHDATPQSSFRSRARPKIGPVCEKRASSSARSSARLGDVSRTARSR